MDYEIKYDSKDVDLLKKEIVKLQEKNRELNRRAQSAASEARKKFVKETWGEGRHHRPLWRACALLGIDHEGCTWNEIENKTVEALKELKAQQETMLENVDDVMYALGLPYGERDFAKALRVIADLKAGKNEK